MKKILLLIALMAFGACGGEKKSTQEAREVKPVKSVTLIKREIKREVVGNSDIRPLNKTTQITKSGGELIEINYKNGDRVERGDLVLRLYNEEVISRYERGKAELTNRKAQMERMKKFSERESRQDEKQALGAYIKAKESLVAAEKRWKEGEVNYIRNKELYDEGLVSEIEFLQLESAYQEAKSNYNSLKSGGVDEMKEKYELAKYRVAEREWEYRISEVTSAYELARAEYTAAEKDYRDLDVEARMTGYVADMDLDLYDELDENIYLFNLLDTEIVRVETTVAGSDISYIELGDEVEVFVEDLEETFEGEVYEINPQGDETTRRFPIKVAIENTAGRLKSGMYATVIMGTRSQVGLIVPKEAVMIKELVEYVAIIRDEKALIVGVTTGISGKKEVEIRAKELEEGDRVVVRGQYLLENGDSVREVE